MHLPIHEILKLVASSVILDGGIYKMVINVSIRGIHRVYNDGGCLQFACWKTQIVFLRSFFLFLLDLLLLLLLGLGLGLWSLLLRCAHVVVLHATQKIRQASANARNKTPLPLKSSALRALRLVFSFCEAVFSRAASLCDFCGWTAPIRKQKCMFFDYRRRKF